MTSKKVWRYKCDFCKKGSCSKFHIASHEKGCTNNPNRICGMCRHNDAPQTPLLELQELLRVGKGTKELMEAANGCPACVLAALRQTEDIPYETFPDVDRSMDFQKCVAEFWVGINDKRAENY